MEIAMQEADVISELRAALGADVVALPHELGDRRWADWSGVPSAVPIALLRPRTTEQVSQALRICARHGQPVVPQGGLTGLVGGACLIGGEVALSLERMNALIELDATSGTMTVGAGMPLQVAQEQAAAAGFYFPLDLGARGSCTIGGNLATNAGGNRVIKYGMMRDQVLGLEAVMSDGRVVDGLTRMVKDNTGYDLKSLIVGSEGTLAVITRAVLRLRPRPGAVATAFCGLPTYAAVTQLLARAQQALPSGASAFEVMWPGYYDFVLSKLPSLRAPLSGRHAFYVLLESVGAEGAAHADTFEAFLSSMLEEGVIQDAALAASESDALSFWAIRDAPGEYSQMMDDHAAFDISFPISDVGHAAERCEAGLRARWPDAIVLVYGHLGDGNIHIVVDIPRGGQGTRTHEDVDEVVYAITRDLRGSVSAEHGIGIKKKRYLSYYRSADEIAAMRAIKSAWDPAGLLNPGKLF